MVKLCFVKIYIKPTCVTCKRTISDLEKQDIKLDKRDMFKDMLSESEIKEILKRSGLSAYELVRKKDKMYKELKIDENTPEEKIIKYMTKYPGLIKRPIIFTKGKVIVGKISSKDL